MSDLAVDFDWYRSDYDFVAPTNPPSVPISKAYIDKPWALEPWIEEERETGALFGKIVARGPTKKIHPDAHRLSVALRALTTIKRNTFDETLFEFRVAVPTIARALGMLDHVSEPGETETLMDWFYLAQTLRNILRIGKKSSASEKKLNLVGTLDIALIANPGRAPTLALRPLTLWDALIWHAARSTAGGASYKMCESCQNPFLTGGARGKDKKRAGARFCSDKCRADYHNAKVRKT